MHMRWLCAFLGIEVEGTTRFPMNSRHRHSLTASTQKKQAEPFGGMDLMRALKRSLNPNDVLNPGKIFD